MIIKLIGMIILGVLGAALSYYRKNLYVNVFDDILGKDEPDQESVRVGRGFVYGFFFPVYFALVLTGLIALVIFLIIAAVLAAIGFAIVWVTEKFIPSDWVGNLMVRIFSTIGMSAPVKADEISTFGSSPAPPESTMQTPTSDSPSGNTAKTESSGDTTNPDAGINVTRKHTLD